MGFFEEHKNGIIGTLVFHIIVLLVLIIIEITTNVKPGEESVIIDFREDVEMLEDMLKDIEKMQELTDLYGEDFLKELRKEIRVKQKVEVEEIDHEKYENQVREEIYGSEDERANKSWHENKLISLEEMRDKLEKEKENNNEQNNEPPKHEKSIRTDINWELTGRNCLKMPNPEYRCEGSGTVSVGILVDQNGKVLDVKIDAESSSADDFCLYKTSVNYAMKARFNTDPDSPARQSGTITYDFIAQ